LGPHKGQKGVQFGELKKIFFSRNGTPNTLVFDIQHP